MVLGSEYSRMTPEEIGKRRLRRIGICVLIGIGLAVLIVWKVLPNEPKVDMSSDPQVSTETIAPADQPTEEPGVDRKG